MGCSFCEVYNSTRCFSVHCARLFSPRLWNCCSVLSCFRVCCADKSFHFWLASGSLDNATAITIFCDNYLRQRTRDNEPATKIFSDKWHAIISPIVYVFFSRLSSFGSLSFRSNSLRVAAQNYKWPSGKECKGKTNYAQSAFSAVGAPEFLSRQEIDVLPPPSGTPTHRPNRHSWNR